jgi:general stress protein 26
MDAPQIDRVWDIVDKVGIAMLTTRFAGGLRARPLEARPDRAAGIIWFLTDVRSGKDEEVAAASDIGLVFIDAADKAYLSITGRAEIARDTARAAAIWKSTDRLWWPEVRRIRPCGCYGSSRTRRSYGTGRRARSSRPSNSPRRGLRGASRIWARTGRSAWR